MTKSNLVELLFSILVLSLVISLGIYLYDGERKSPTYDRCVREKVIGYTEEGKLVDRYLHYQIRQHCGYLTEQE